MRRVTSLILQFIEGIIRNIGGSIGVTVRYMYYKKRFKKCGENVKISEGVIFHSPQNITVGHNVWFNAYSIITAASTKQLEENRILIKKVNEKYTDPPGTINIGNHVAIGSYCVIQGLGGIRMEDNVILSDYVKLFSFSHHPFDPEDRTKITHCSSYNSGAPIVCIESPLVIETGSWLALNCTMFRGTIGDHSFIATDSVVLSDIIPNSYAVGNPAKKVKNRFDLD